LRCLAAPVLDARAELVAAISISGPAADFEGAQHAVLLAALLEQARGLSVRLGCPAPVAATSAGGGA
jgi:DNA-binding IclR family transcriptional regulator